jgi:ribosomal protein S18 acetylase RimI-like enzyme
MGAEDLSIERVLEATDELVAAFADLLPQLSSTAPPDLAGLDAIVANAATTLLIARVAGKIVGSLSLATFATPTGVRAWIEDVVVDGSMRGKGIATDLIHHAIEVAGSIGARSIDLTSRPSRVAANGLYQRLGFALRETNVYRYTLEG